MNNDQWFEPSQKVVRVTTADVLGLTANGILVPETDFGHVLCVERCWSSLWGNLVRFVGVEMPDGAGFYACCFRRVEEIQLCVMAARKCGEPQEQPINAS